MKEEDGIVEPLTFHLVLDPVPSQKDEQAAHAWTPPLRLQRYQGPYVPLDATGHSWERLIYFWASDVALVEKLDKQIQALFSGDLRRWRLVIVAVFGEPEILWKVPFDSD